MRHFGKRPVEDVVEALLAAKEAAPPRATEPLSRAETRAAMKDLGSLLERPVPNATFHLGLAGFAIVVVYVARRAIPEAWSWFTVLYLAPSLLLGIVGMGRYATEAFPPGIAAGTLLARHRRRTIALILGVMVVAQALCVSWFIAEGRLL